MVQVDVKRRGFRKLPARYAGVVLPLVLSIFMSGVVSAVATAANGGGGPHFLPSWLNAWGASWLVAFPTLLLVLPIVRRLVGAIVELPR